MVVLGSLAETSVSLSLGGETSGLSVLVDGVGDPVDSGVSSDGLVLGAKGRTGHRGIFGRGESIQGGCEEKQMIDSNDV